MPEIQPLTARRAMNASKKGIYLCPTCEKRIRSKNRRKKFCSDRCRLLHWALAIIVKERKAGKVNGLKNLIKELCE